LTLSAWLEADEQPFTSRRWYATMPPLFQGFAPADRFGTQSYTFHI